jgi:hypothetical protein
MLILHYRLAGAVVHALEVLSQERDGLPGVEEHEHWMAVLHWLKAALGEQPGP